MQFITKVAKLQKFIKNYKQNNPNNIIALVPTMGNLHLGHITLVTEARQKADLVVVSIFINQLQFGKNEDFSQYLQTINQDLSLLKDLQIIVFAPTSQDIYKSKLSHEELNANALDSITKINPPANLANILEGKARIGFFNGVATIVVKLFNLCQPDIAFFGEKDFQQLIILKKMVEDLNLRIKIVAMPIVRENNGLAMSSRNNYLNNKQKQHLGVIYKSMYNVKLEIRDTYKTKIKKNDLKQIKKILSKQIKMLQNNEIEIDYFGIYDSCTLKSIEQILDSLNEVKLTGLRILIAALYKKVRFIDNIAL